MSVSEDNRENLLWLFGPASGTHGHKPEPGATGSCAAIPSRLLTLVTSRPAIVPIALTLRPRPRAAAL